MVLEVVLSVGVEIWRRRPVVGRVIQRLPRRRREDRRSIRSRRETEVGHVADGRGN